MKSEIILLILLLTITSSCKDKETNNRISAINYMENIAKETNEKLNLPKQVDEFTIAEKVIYDANKNTLTYNYKLYTDTYSKYDWIETLKEIEIEQIRSAKKLHSDNPNYKLLKVSINSVYKDFNGKEIYSFKIKPEQYLNNEFDLTLNNPINTNPIDSVFYNNGKLKTVGKRENGEQTGRWEYHTQDGNLDYTINFLNGEPHGLNKMYHTNGRLMRVGKYNNGKKTGVWKSFNDKGVLVYTGKYNNGIQSGMWKYYHQNGKIEQKGSFINGIKDGKWEYYHKEGYLLRSGAHLNNKLNGVWKYFYENGKIEQYGEYQNNIPIGEWRHYDKNGKLIKSTSTKRIQ